MNQRRTVRSTPMRATAVGALLLASVALAACGDDDDTGSSAGGKDYCTVAKELDAAGDALGSVDDPAAAKAAFQKAVGLAAQAAAAAPAEIKADLASMTDGIKKMNDILSKNGYDLTKVSDADKEAVSKMQNDPAMKAANERVKAYDAKNCSSTTAGSTAGTTA